MIEDGTIRITGTRIPIETVLYHYQQGEPPEEIQEAFPTLKLADIYSVISYYLNHREVVEEYLRQQKIKAEEWRRIIEASPLAIDREAWRARLQERWQALQAAKLNGHSE